MVSSTIEKINCKLNKIFDNAVGRQIVFWFDEKAEFKDSIQQIRLTNAELYIMYENTYFYTQYMLEIEKVNRNMLVYAPFPMPDKSINPLLDVMYYSEVFSAEITDMIINELKCSKKCKKLIEEHIKFFNDNNIKKLQNIGSQLDENNLIKAILNILSGSHIYSNDYYIINTIENEFKKKTVLSNYKKYNLLDEFWENVSEYFTSDKKSAIVQYKNIDFLVLSIWVTEILGRINLSKIPHEWQQYCLSNHGNVSHIFSILCKNNIVMEHIVLLEKKLNLKSCITNEYIDSIVLCHGFQYFENMIIEWITSCIIAENTSIKINNIGLNDIWNYRKENLLARTFEHEYKMLQSAYNIILIKNFTCATSLNDIINGYIDNYYQIDKDYRLFYYHYDQICNNEKFIELKDKVEKIYSESYLSTLISAWNDAVINEGFKTNYYSDKYFSQNQFYKLIKNEMGDGRAIVIISDSLRFEIGASILKKFPADKSEHIYKKALITSLPSITSIGMANLLPHNQLAVDDKLDILLDGKACYNTEQREKILQGKSSKSKCIQFEIINTMSRQEIRNFVKDTDIIYIYHNRIDAIGDNNQTENNVFNACEQTITEINNFITKCTSNTSINYYYITADHGFLYKRNKLTENYKLDNFLQHSDSKLLKRRYAISDEKEEQHGILSFAFNDLYNTSNDCRYLYVPYSQNIFKASGGANYVHGGSSPQEMIVPFISLKTKRKAKDLNYVQIEFISYPNEINNLVYIPTFIQTKSVDHEYLEAIYEVYIKSDSGELVSNIITIHANIETNKQDELLIKSNPLKLKEKQYKKEDRYQLCIRQKIENEYVDIQNRKIIINIPFSNDYGF